MFQIYDEKVFVIGFDIPTYINIYTRYPESLFNGISRLGGFFAAFNVVFIGLLFFNRIRFERRIKRINTEFKERYSIENFEKMINRIEQLEKEIDLLKGNNI